MAAADAPPAPENDVDIEEKGDALDDFDGLEEGEVAVVAEVLGVLRGFLLQYLVP